MDDAVTPSLADDEAALARYADALADHVAAVAETWLVGLVAQRAPGLETDPRVAANLRDAASSTARDLRHLLGLDIAEQTVGPLEILRRAVAVPTQILADANIAAVQRDEFARSNFPDDVYDLTPASFAAIDPVLHEPGLTWGAAKAHVHLRRRREMAPSEVDSTAVRRVVALSADLMDRSKISAALPDATLVRSPQKLLDQMADADLVLVDLGRLPDPSILREITSPMIAFGSHVNEDQLKAAETAGAESLPRSVFFRRLEAGQI